MFRSRRILFLGVVWSCWWTVLFVCGYSRTDYDRAAAGPPWAESLLWTATVHTLNEESGREFPLPDDFRSPARKGDRVEHVTHTLDFLGVRSCAAEVFLWREELKLRAWREYGLPFPVLAVLWIMTPFAVAGIVAGSMDYVRPDPKPLTWVALFRESDVRFILGAAALAILSVAWRVGIYEGNAPALVCRAAQSLRGAAYDGDPNGAWTGDVTELYRMGLIRRAVAEADTAPLRPLVPKPRPYHGYFFVAMETGPEGVPLKQSNRTREELAFCAYPAEEGPNQRVWLVCSTGFFGCNMDGGKPILNWPTPEEMRQGWGRYCALPQPGSSSQTLVASIR